MPEPIAGMKWLATTNVSGKHPTCQNAVWAAGLEASHEGAFAALLEPYLAPSSPTISSKPLDVSSFLD